MAASIEPLLNPYLWAIGPAAERLPPGIKAGDRYQVIAPQVWLDTQPASPPQPPEQLPRELLPYHYLYPERLHLPLVYGLCTIPQGTVVLLENAPLEGAGALLPRLDVSLPQARPLRQVSWLWQLLELWQKLAPWGVAASLLVPDNLRVQGGIVRLRELYGSVGTDSPLGADLDSPFERYTDTDTPLPNLGDLAYLWRNWIPRLAEPLQAPILDLCEQLHRPHLNLQRVRQQLNQLILMETARSPLKLNTIGQSHPGQIQRHNEDSCFPQASDLASESDVTVLVPHLGVICDGVGGHEGGEVASQLALRSLKLQIRALLQEIQKQAAPLTPDGIEELITASIRVVNNLITAQNDLKGRNDRQRMGSTLVMALHVQQPLPGTQDTSHELYLAHLGDSRAYWVTQRSCQRLTVDDDVAGREVRLGRSFYRQSLQQEDATCLTQALGTRAGSDLHVHVQRLIVDEDGVLFLCSDGLSDHGWVDRHWNGLMVSLLTEMQSLEEVTQEWIDLGNQKNGHDNLSVVLMNCRVSPDYPILLDPFPPAVVHTPEELAPPESQDLALANPPDTLTEASAALLAETAEVTPSDRPKKPLTRARLVWLILILILASLGIGLGVLITLDPDRLPPALERWLPQRRSP